MKKILSIQSHVASGYVGNKAAVFPLQCMGYEVIAINTVQFSNHTGYGNWTGDIFEVRHIEDILAGLQAGGFLDDVAAVLSGYLGDAKIGEIVLNAVQNIRRKNEDLIYCCDPVMGDIGRGFFVRKNIPPFFAQTVPTNANILTPNQFELGYLCGLEINSVEDASKACNKMHEQGVETILVTSLIPANIADDKIQMLASRKNGEQFLITTPRLNMDPMPNGAGDCMSALFLGAILSGHGLKDALERATTDIFSLFEKTHEQNSRELAMIESQEIFRIDEKKFTAEKL